MKITLLLILFSLNSFAVYEKDTRVDYYQVKNKTHKKIMSTMAYQLYMDELRGWKFSKFWKLVTKPLGSYGLCESEKFQEQSVFRNDCSGILVGKDLLLTPGHCLTEHYCKNDLFYWVFDYRMESKNEQITHIRGKKFYQCKEVLKRVYNNTTGVSYALIRLKKKVMDREPVKLSSNPSVGGVDLVTSGFPFGMPIKLNTDVKSYDESNKAFITNSDITGANKGTGVFNSNTGELEGMLIYGTKNYINSPSGCSANPVYPNNEAQELAVKASYLKEQLKEFL